MSPFLGKAFNMCCWMLLEFLRLEEESLELLQRRSLLMIVRSVVRLIATCMLEYHHESHHQRQDFVSITPLRGILPTVKRLS